MRTDGGGRTRSVLAPVSLIASAFARVSDARRTLTPMLELGEASRLLLIDLGAGKNRLGGSCWTFASVACRYAQRDMCGGAS